MKYPKKYLPLLAFLFIFTPFFAQISGTFSQDGFPYPLVKVYFEGVKPKVTSQFDGSFQLKIPQDSIHNTLVMEYDGITLEISQCPLKGNAALDLGTIVLPKLKQLSVDQYHQLKRKQRKQCLPMYDGEKIVGYKSHFELEQLQFRCKEENNSIPYVYDAKRKRFVLSWDEMMLCN
ncbi:MAG: hypothetical protein R2793_00205 [Flavobacteriaceae bacterium]